MYCGGRKIVLCSAYDLITIPVSTPGPTNISTPQHYAKPYIDGVSHRVSQYLKVIGLTKHKLMLEPQILYSNPHQAIA